VRWLGGGGARVFTFGLGVALSLILIAACDPGMRFRLPPPEERLTLEPQAATASFGTLMAETRYLGPGERVPSNRNLLGAVLRYVNPYGEDQILFEVYVRNEGAESVMILPEQAVLDTGARDIRALGLEHYKRAWPTYPITDSEMAKDQAVAFTYVLRSILLRRQVLPGEATSGRLAFPAPAGAQGPLTLRLPLQEGDATASVGFAFEAVFPKYGEERAL
jgi:hypothetical protein